MSIFAIVITCISKMVLSVIKIIKLKFSIYEVSGPICREWHQLFKYKSNCFCCVNQWRNQEERWEASPRNPKNFTKEWKQPRPKSAIRIDNSKNYNFRLIFSNLY